MRAAARLLPFEHMPCTAHIVQRSHLCLSDRGFVNVLAKCHKIVGYFKHRPPNVHHGTPWNFKDSKRPFGSSRSHWYVTEILGGEAYVSCSVVLPALCHLHHVIKVSDDDPADLVRFNTTLKEDLALRQKNTNNALLKLAKALDPCFKDLTSLPKSEREAVWATHLEACYMNSHPEGLCRPLKMG